MHAEQLEQQKKLTEIMVQMQAAISAKKVGDSTKTLLASSKTSKTSVPGIRHREMCPSPSLNDVDGDEIEEDNMNGDDTPSQFDQNNQREEEEEIEEDEDFTFGKPASKKIKPLPAQLQYWSEAREVGDEYHEDAWKKVMPTKLVTL